MPFGISETTTPTDVATFWDIFKRFLRKLFDFSVIGPVNLPVAGTAGNRVSHGRSAAPKLVIPVVITPAVTVDYPRVMLRSMDARGVTLVTDIATDVMLLVVF